MPETPSLNSLMGALGGRRLPPVEQWNPPFCGDIDMRIASDGSWHYLGTPIGRPAMVQLFASVLRREPDGRYVLVTPVEKVGIQVDDAPFIAVELRHEGMGRNRHMAFRLLTDEWVPLDAAHPLRVSVDPQTEAPRPYLMVRGGMEALVNRPVFYELVSLADGEAPAGAPLGLWSGGRFWRLDGGA